MVLFLQPQVMVHLLLMNATMRGLILAYGALSLVVTGAMVPLRGLFTGLWAVLRRTRTRLLGGRAPSENLKTDLNTKLINFLIKICYNIFVNKILQGIMRAKIIPSIHYT